MKPGIYSNISNADYHGGNGISKTQLDKAAKSPLHYAYHQDHKQESTPAMDFGTATHTYILEPDKFLEEIAVAPDVNRRTKAGKEQWAAFTEANADKLVISKSDMQTIESMSNAVFDHPTASLLLTDGTAEQSAYWVDGDTGLTCRCRPDYQKNRVLVDLKTTKDASPLGFGRSAAQLRYHVQAAYYLDGFNAAGGDVTDFAFVAVEKEPPYAVAVYAAEEIHLEKGRELYRRDLERLNDAIKRNQFAGYGDEPMPLFLPEWALS